MLDLFLQLFQFFWSSSDLSIMLHLLGILDLYTGSIWNCTSLIFLWNDEYSERRASSECSERIIGVILSDKEEYLHYISLQQTLVNLFITLLVSCYSSHASVVSVVFKPDIYLIPKSNTKSKFLSQKKNSITFPPLAFAETLLQLISLSNLSGFF